MNSVRGRKSKSKELKWYSLWPIRSKVLKAMLASSPYEEPAYDLFALNQQSNEYGLGRIGKLQEKTTLAQFAEHVKTAFGVPALRFVGDPNKEIRKVAVLGGDGNKYIGAAKRSWSGCSCNRRFVLPCCP